MSNPPLVTAEEMRNIEETAFAAGATAEALMEKAGRGIADTVEKFFPNGGTFEAHYGKGHNGGDILVAACYLAERGWRIIERPAFPEASLTPLTAKCLARLRVIASPKKDTEATASHRGGRGVGSTENTENAGSSGGEVEQSPSIPSTPSILSIPSPSASSPLVIGDGLLGIGARGAPRGEIAQAIAAINTARNERRAWVIAADIPSGLDADTGIPATDCVTADCTATIGFAKKGLVADTATNYVGRLELIPLGMESSALCIYAHISTSHKNECLITSAPMPVLPYDRHKGDAGRVSLVVGSMRYPGAARLAAAAAVRGGAGLVTLFVPPELAPILAASCVPEVMIFPTDDIREVLRHPADAIAIGPGLGHGRDLHVTHIIAEATVPLVIDADALNALAESSCHGTMRTIRTNGTLGTPPKSQSSQASQMSQMSHNENVHETPILLSRARAPRILTPHPGEMERLYPRNGRTRRDWARDFATKFLSPADTLILKGSRTIVATSDGTLFYNTTGNPGMASGGMGDVLTGVTAAFLAQKIPPLEAAKNAVYLCGRAAEIAVVHIQSPQSLCASDIISHLGLAMRETPAM